MEKISHYQIDVSVIIVNYNALKLLRNCLKSIYTHTKGLKFEVIVIDNNSTDGDVGDLKEEFNELIIIKNDNNVGFGPANNQGIQIAKGKYILFLNNDTYFIENTLYKVFKFSEEKNEKLFLGCKLLNEDLTLQYSVYNFPTVWGIFTSNFFLYAIFPKSKIFNKFHLMNRKIDYVCEAEVIIGAFLFCSAAAVRDLEGFDNKFYFYSEETDLCYRFKKNGGRLFYYPKTSIVHLKGATADKNPWFKYKNQSIAQIKFFQKHFSKFNLIFALLFHFFGILIRIPLLFVGGVILGRKRLILRSFYYLKLLFVYPRNEF
ncbi:glycosyltransferase family 2 protein [Bacteroidota bacterium]